MESYQRQYDACIRDAVIAGRKLGEYLLTDISSETIPYEHLLPEVDDAVDQIRP